LYWLLKMFDWLSPLVDKFNSWLVGLLPDWLGSGFSDLSALFGPTAKYFAYLGGFDVVIPVIITAYTVKFLIRRLPVVG
jgi:hypothetical protein